MKKTLITLLCTVALTLPAWAQQKVDETRTVAADAAITVESISGSVVVVGWDRNEVQVTGTLGRGLDKLDVSGSAQRLDIRVVYPHNCHNCEGADLEIRVPAGSRPEINTVSADIDISKVRSDVRAESVSGTVKVSAGGNVRAKTVSGDVVIRQAGQDVDATTVSGALQAAVGVLKTGEFESVSGDIRVEADLGPQARLEAKTVSGSVELGLPSGVNADFDVRSFSGRIRNDLGPEARRRSEYGPGYELEFTTGNASARVYVKTLSGSITLRKR